MPKALCSHERQILAVLSDEGGFTTRDVARRAGFWMSSNPRSNSAQFRDRLMRMRGRGLVDVLDDQKPVCWTRTPAGAAALEADGGRHA